MDTSHLDDYFNALEKALASLDKASVSALAEQLIKTCDAGATTYIFGNGGSGATASHACGDLVKGASYGLEKRFKVVCLNDNTPTVTAIANDLTYDDVFVEQLRNFLHKEDLVIGISGSGNSANIVKALEYANEVGATTVAMCGYSGGAIKKIATLAVHVPVMDMEITEDVHMSIFHAIKQTVMKHLGHSFKMGEAYEARIR